MNSIDRPRLDVQGERFWLQAHFLNPVFDLFKDLPSLLHHLFQALGPHYGLRLSNINFEAGTGGLGEIVLRLSWPNLAEVRIFIDRIEIAPSFLPFLKFQERDLVNDVLDAAAAYSPSVKFRTYSVTQEVHGKLEGQSRAEFLARFAPSVPDSFGPMLGTGIVLYFGAEEDHLFASFTLDFSRDIEGGIFVQSVILYDASRVSASDLQDLSSLRFQSLFYQIGLAR